MKTYSFINRLKNLITKGAKIGAVFGFCASLIYMLMFIAALAIDFFFHIPNGAEENMTTLFMISLVMCFAGILPATVIGVIGGGLIGLVLSFWRNRVPSILAIVVGVIVGGTLILAGNYLQWTHLQSIGLQDRFGNPYSFWEYLFPHPPQGPLSLISFTYTPNDYFLPSIIAFLLFAYAGWRINNKRI